MPLDPELVFQSLLAQIEREEGPEAARERLALRHAEERALARFGSWGRLRRWARNLRKGSRSIVISRRGYAVGVLDEEGTLHLSRTAQPHEACFVLEL